MEIASRVWGGKIDDELMRFIWSQVDVMTWGFLC